MVAQTGVVDAVPLVVIAKIARIAVDPIGIHPPELVIDIPGRDQADLW